MEMVPYSFDADWYRSIESFPLLCSSSPALGLATTEQDDNLRIAGSNSLQAGSLSQVAADDSSSSSAMVLRDDEHTYNNLPMFVPAPAPLAAAGDPFYFDRLPPLPASLDDDALLLQTLSDIDLDAFGCGGVDEHKPPPPPSPHPLADNMMMTAMMPADGQDDDQKPIAVAADCYRPPGADGVRSFDLAVVLHGEHHQQHEEASSLAPPLLPPPPPMARHRQVTRRTGGHRPAPSAGKTRLDHIGFDEIRKYFYMPITQAAHEMNVGLTVLKKRCRELGVARWPHRKMKSLRSLILNVQEMGKGLAPAAVQRELEAYCALMEEDPSIELTDRTKKLRQACFKENYKRRRAATVRNVVDHVYNDFSHGHHHELITLQETSSSSTGSSHFFTC